MSTESLRSDAILKRLMDLHPKVIDLTLERVHRLLDTLDNPERRLPPVIHVAGTNGKGSTISFLRSILSQAGYRCHVYTSPHLVRFAERIVLAGEMIEEAALSDYLERCETANAGAPITYFEITTCAALLAFAETPADVLLLEVGLGGRLDATNVVDWPVCTVITPVSMDHMQFLGGTLAEIAAEKAAIQKPGVPSIVAPQEPDADAVIRAAAEKVGAALHDAGPLEPGMPLGLKGGHQAINAGVARDVIQVLRRAGFRISDADFEQGLAAAAWPARLQRLRAGPVLDILGPDWEVWLDGGHNAAAGEMLADHAGSHWGDRPLHIACGMLNTKAVADFLRPLGSVCGQAYAVAIPGEPNSLSAEELCAAARAEGLACETAKTVTDAARSARSQQAGRLLICGSLYLAGEILSVHT